MRICLVRPPTFVPTGETYPYNLDCIATALKNAGHDISWVDGELIAEEEISSCTSNPTLYRRLAYLLEKGKRRNSLKLLDHVYSGEKSRVRNTIIESIFADTGHSMWERIANKIYASSPDIVGLSCYSASMSSVLALVKILRDRYGLTAPIMLGGPHPSAFPEETIQKTPGVDYVVIGEGEQTVVELVDAISSGERYPKRVNGIAFRKNGNVERTGPRALITDMAELPVPGFEFAGEPYKNYVLLTSRGCPFDCHYCASKIVWGRRARYRPSESIAREIANLKLKTDVRYIRFGDDTYTLDKRHMRAVAESLAKADIKDVSYSIGSRIDTIDHEKLEILKALGVHMVSFGVETGSRRIMRMVDKNVDVGKVTPTIRMVNDAGIHTLTYFILNHPDETLADMRDTLTLMKEINRYCRLNINELNIGFPYPGTPWWNYCKDKNLLSGIDIYNNAHQYHHKQMPVVNMTRESMGTVTYVKSLVDQSERPTLIRKALGTLVN